VVFPREGAHKTLRRDGRLWADGGAGYLLYDSDYNYWTPNGWISNTNVDINNPPTASFPVKNIEGSFAKKSQILPYAGFRHFSVGPGVIANQGYDGDFWASTPSSSTQGYIILFYSSNMQPVHPAAYYPFGLSIRCVRI
jgi:hypothetical protein